MIMEYKMILLMNKRPAKEKSEFCWSLPSNTETTNIAVAQRIALAMMTNDISLCSGRKR